MKNPKSKRKSNTQKQETGRKAGDFAFNVTKVAVSQICRSVGFRRSQASALETLTRVATKYLEALAKSAVSFSNAASRTQSNLLDLTNALHDLSLLRGGFTAASTLHHRTNCLLKSSVLEGLSGFVRSTIEMPFAKPIQRREEVKTASPSSSSSSAAAAAAAAGGNLLQRGAHVPEWLPGLPDVGSEEKCEKKRVDGEELWENCSSVLGCQSDGFGEKRNGSSSNKGGKLAKKRTRVKFRINGGGKRVHLNSFRGNNEFTQTKDEEADVEYEKLVKSHKRRKL